MTTDAFSTPVLTGCDAVQYQLSEIADSGAELPPEIHAHLDGCDACARFAEQWLSGPPAALARPAAAEPDAALRERILNAAAPAPANVVPFTPPAPRSAASGVWLGRVAACAALAGLAWWLLNPTVSPVGTGPVAEPPPTLAQTLGRVESRSVRERQIVSTALRDGGRQVNENVAWSASALEL